MRIFNINNFASKTLEFEISKIYPDINSILIEEEANVGRVINQRITLGIMHNCDIIYTSFIRKNEEIVAYTVEHIKKLFRRYDIYINSQDMYDEFLERQVELRHYVKYRNYKYFDYDKCLEDIALGGDSYESPVEELRRIISKEYLLAS